MLYGLLLEICARNPYDCTAATTINVVRNSSKIVPSFLCLLYLFLCNKCTSKIRATALECVLYLCCTDCSSLAVVRTVKSVPYGLHKVVVPSSIFVPKNQQYGFPKIHTVRPCQVLYLPRFLCLLAALGNVPSLLQLSLLTQARLPLLFLSQQMNA
jgi:hypothetical protein